MTAVPKILTKREFLQQTELTDTTLNHWVHEQLLIPVNVLSNKVIFFPRHLLLVQKLKQLIQQGYSIEQLRQMIQNEDINTEEVTLNIRPHYASMSYEQLVEEARRQHIRNFRRMSKEQLVICLNEPDRRDEIVALVRDQLRRQRQGEEVMEEPVVEIEEGLEETPAAPTERERELSALQYVDLVAMAQQEHIRYFRQMSKAQLIDCLANPQNRDQIVEQVRQQTRERYGNGRTDTNRPVRANRVVEVNRIAAVLDEAPTETIEEVMEEVFVEVMDTTVEANIQAVQEEQEDVVEEVVVENNEPIIATMPDGTSVTIQMSAYTTHTHDQLLDMNSKIVGNAARDANLFPYFRRMTKAELIEALLQPETRQQHVLRAWERYQLYVGRQYGRD